MHQWPDLLLHPVLRADAETRRRGRLTVLGALVLLGTAAAYAAFYGVLVGYVAGARILLVGAAVALVALVALRQRPWLHAVGQLLTLGVFGVVVALMACEGGVRALATPLLSVPPILAILLLGRRGAVGWTAASVLTVVAFGALEAHGVRFPTLYPEAWAARMSVGSPVALVVCTALLLVVVENTRADAQSRADAARAALARLAFHDPLTGLANRAHFVARLETVLAAAQAAGDPARVTVLMLDLDGFKAVNDTMGHAAGDAVLTLVGERLRHAAPEGDTVARLGGDEFAVLLDGRCRAVTGGAVAARIVAALARPFPLESEWPASGGASGSRTGARPRRARGESTPTGARTGVAPYGGAGVLLRDADAALYRAKALGRGRWVAFEAGMRPGATGGPPGGPSGGAAPAGPGAPGTRGPRGVPIAAPA
jgi:diguanylate cyclase (GGDEF)-like protein